MKQFNLDEYLQYGREVCTRDEKNVRIICTNRKHDTYHVIALIDRGTKEHLCGFTENGQFCVREEHDNDLFFKPIIKKIYIGAYRNRCGVISTSVFHNTHDVTGSPDVKDLELIDVIEKEYELD